MGPASPAAGSSGGGTRELRRSWLPPGVMNQIRGDSQARSRECREWFGLPDTEDLLEEYSCALLKKILLQGRMYVFREHICFYSKVFTFVTKRTIELSTVTSINRAKNMGFPNSIEVIGGGKRLFFTSFLFREDAYRQMVASWSKCSPYARLFIGDSGDMSQRRSPGASPPARAGSAPPPERALDMVSPLAAAAAPAGTSPPTPASAAAPAPDPDAPPFRAAAPPPALELSPAPPTRGSLGSARSLPTMCDGDSLLLGHANDPTFESLRSHARTQSSPEDLSHLQAASLSVGGARGSLEPPSSANSYHQKRTSLESVSTHTTNPRDTYSGSASDEFTGSDGENGDGGARGEEQLHEPFSGDDDDTNDLGIYASPPPLPEGSTVLLERDFSLSPLEFHQMFFSDRSRFLERLHEALGDSDVTCTEWKSHSFLGHARDFTFHKKLIAFSALGANSRVSCHQAQRVGLYRVGGKEHLVFESSQVNSDVPFGDCFVVRTRWDVVRRVGDGGPSRLTYSVAVPFSKPTLLKSTIEKNAIALCRKNAEHFLKFAQSEVNRSSAKLSGDLPQDEQHAIDAEKIPLEWRDQIVQMLSLNNRPAATSSPRPSELGAEAPPMLSSGPSTLSLAALRFLGPALAGLAFALQALFLLPWKLQVVAWHGVHSLQGAARWSLGRVGRVDPLLVGVVAVVAVQLFFLHRMGGPAPEPFPAGLQPPSLHRGQQQARLHEHALSLRRELSAVQQVAAGLQSELELVEALQRRLREGGPGG